MASHVLAKMREKVMRARGNTVVVATDDLEALIDLHDSAVASVEAFGEHCASAVAAARDEAFEEAAKIADAEQAEYEKSAKDFDSRGEHKSGTIELHGAIACRTVAEKIRARALKEGR